jgi:NADH-quinone oxidoreductase subunit J
LSPALFYILGGCAVVATFMAITRTETVHAIAYLVLSFFSLALIFFMLGAPLIAALEVIVYAGAIMVLFLFIVMMLDMASDKRPSRPYWRVWGPPAALASVILASAGLMFSKGASRYMIADTGFISPREFGEALYSRHMLPVEIVSLLLLFALVGALYLGRTEE